MSILPVLLLSCIAGLPIDVPGPGHGRRVVASRLRPSNWRDRWTFEFERKLDTGHADDARFDLARGSRFAVAIQDRTGDMDKASGAIELSFGAK